MYNIQRLLTLLLFLVAANAWALDCWTVSLTPQALFGNYSSSPVRSEIKSQGLLLNTQYLERDAILLGYFPLQLRYKHNIPGLHQATYYASLRDFQTPDCLKGWLTFRLDAYKVYNNDPTHETTNVNVIQPLISYINYAKTYYFDFGYAASSYAKSHIRNGQLRVSQFTPSVGIGFNENTNWLRLRLYEIYASNYIRAQHMTHTDGVEITFSHYLLYYPFYIPNRIDAEVYLGNRTYAVDSDAMVVYNLGDVQQTGMYLQANWRLTSHVNFLVNGGHLNFTTLLPKNSFPFRLKRFPYALNYIYAGVTVSV